MAEIKSLLLVEDNSRDVELTLAAFEESHLANIVDVARDGVEALDYLYRWGRFADRPAGDPAVVLLDIKMPRLNGLEVLRRIKSDPQFKELPVVIFTSSREESDMDECHVMGVNSYVVKPVEFSQFVAAVKQVGAFWAILNERQSQQPPPPTPNGI